MGEWEVHCCARKVDEGGLILTGLKVEWKLLGGAIGGEGSFT